MAKPGRIPAPTSCAYWRARETGQAPCYAVEHTVSPVRVHSPVRYISAPRIGRARVSIEPSAMKPALRIWSPVRLLGPAYMAPALRTVSRFACIAQCGLFHLAALAGRSGAFNQVRLGRLGAQELQCACTVRSIRYHLHASALRWQLPALALRCMSSAQYHQCRHHAPGLQCASPVRRSRSLPPLRRCQSFCCSVHRRQSSSVQCCRSLPPLQRCRSLQSAQRRLSCPSAQRHQSPVCPAPPELPSAA
ncbi:uncharacterized protein LOC135511567 [Oncorhynchus masou masou]|uniref:uncharacterized protein LOC135511567 n=1 Tax=Oncorhynchus masou masou TaxID=90313 RepID=UPI003182FA12